MAKTLEQVVNELVKLLQELPPNTPVIVDDYGYDGVHESIKDIHVEKIGMLQKGVILGI